MEGRDCAGGFSFGRGVFAELGGGIVLWAAVVHESCSNAISGRVAYALYRPKKWVGNSSNLCTANSSGVSSGISPPFGNA